MGRHSPSTEQIDLLHQHDCLEIGFCHEGAGVFIVEDKVLPFGDGDVSVINNLEMHRARSASGAISSWSFLLLDPARLLSATVDERDVLRTSNLGGPGFRNILKSNEHRETAATVRGIVDELNAGRAGYRAVVRGLVLALMAMLQRLAADTPMSARSGAGGAAERVAPALDYLARHYSEPVTIPPLAQMCFASESNFRRLFKLATARSPQEYLTYLRIQMATALLESTSLAVLEISGRVGYQTLSSFNRHFKRITGCAPRGWRRRATGSGA